ncbi:MAG TPA: hypothetical protein VGP07_02665 [Polyangia bacterium]
MKARTAGILAALFVCSFIVVARRPALAADKDAVAEKVTVLNRAAVAAYGDGDFKKMKSKLMEALKLGKDVLGDHPMLARTYLHLGVLYVDGLDDRAAGIKYFSQALKLNPDIQITSGMVTKTVTAAFDEAKAGPKGGAGKAAAAAASDDDEEEDEAPKAKAAPAPKGRQARESASDGDDGRSAKALEAEKRRNAAEVKEVESQSRTERDRLQKELAQAKENAATERAEKERLQGQLKQIVAEAKKQMQDSDAESRREKQQAEVEAKKQAQQADVDAKKQALEVDKERAEKDKTIADGLAREKKERDAKEKLEKQLQDKDKLLAEAKQALADAKQRIQQADKDKADKDKTIADGLAREKKERDAKDKLEKVKEATEARDSDRKAREEKERAERETLAAGPELPSHFSESVYCDVPETAPTGTDLYVHCLAQPKAKAKSISFLYRATGSAVYSALVMEKNKKGWYMAMIPGDRISGKLLQYYAEARDGKGGMVAASGKQSSPNILTLKSK